jgi:hypothetical protein
MVVADDDRDDAAILAAIADLGRDGPLRTDDLARARTTFGDFQRRRRKATMVRTAAIGGVALAAALVLGLVRFAPELRAQLGAEDGALSQSEHQIGTEEQGGDASERRAPTSVRPSVTPAIAVPVEAPAPEPVVTIVPPAPEPAPAPRKAVTRPVVHASAGEMLAQARALTHAKKLGPAAAAYESLIEQHPASAEARAASVSLGRVQLSRGKPKQALVAFDRYLEGGSGTLAEEAHWGRIQALHALGRARDRDAATAAFASKFPGSMYLPKAKALAK